MVWKVYKLMPSGSTVAASIRPMERPNRLFTVPIRKFVYLKNTSMERLPTMETIKNSRRILGFWSNFSIARPEK